jgi:membrane-associated protein
MAVEFSGSILNNYPFIAQNKYLLIFLIGLFEGFGSLLFAGFLVSINVLSLAPTFLVMLGSEITNGFMWYAVGYWGGSRPIEWIIAGNKKKQNFLERVKRYFEMYAGVAILLAKLTFSVTILTMIFVGSIRYNLKKFGFYNIVGSFFWVIMILAAGYFFGEGYKVFFQYWKNVSHFVLYIIVAIALIYLIRMALRTVVIDYMALVEKIDSLTEKSRNWLDKFISPPKK